MYVKSIDFTQPGTDINVTPDKDAPTIPNATTYQGDCLFPTKKPLLSALRPVKYDISKRRAKYPTTTESIVIGVTVINFNDNQK